MYTIAELVQQKEVKRGNRITYRPEVKEYLPNAYSMGCENEMLYTNPDELMWIVRHIYPNGDIEITTNVALHAGEVSMRGILGYVRGPEELHRICRNLYSHSGIHAYAQSYTIETLNQDNGYLPEGDRRKYAYYYTSKELEGTYSYQGMMYEKKNIPSTISGFRFYAFDAGGMRKTDEYGMEFREPTQDSPVLVSSNYYRYRQYSQVGDYWLASPCIATGFSGIYYYVRYTDWTIVEASLLCDSNLNVAIAAHGIRPVVRLSGSLFLSDNFTINGEKGWNLLN